MNTAEQLRAAAHRSQSRRIDGRRVPVTFAGGPLDGQTIAVAEADARNELIGFATVTDTGCVQAVYRRGAGGVWRFDGMDAGVR